MYPQDRVLVGVMPNPRDLEVAHEAGWYRIPESKAPRGIHAEYIAFYFTKKYPDDLRWGIHYYARRTGHELVRRVDLLPDQPNHPRAEQQYYKIQLGPLRQKEPPIVSVRWRRITFIQTTWDRFVAAREVNDLYSTDDQFVDRVYHALKREGIQPDREVQITEKGQRFTVDMVIPCHDGAVIVSHGETHPARALVLSGDESRDLAAVHRAMDQRGGPITVDLPL